MEVVDRTVLPPKTERSAALLARLSVPTVSREIRPQVPDRRLGLRLVDLPRLVEALEYLDLGDDAPLEELPTFLQDEGAREALGALLAGLVSKAPPDDELSSGPRSSGWQHRWTVHSLEAAYLADKVTANAFGSFLSGPP